MHKRDSVKPLCVECDAKDMPHAPFINCKDNQIEWLGFRLEKANQRIEFLEEILGIYYK